ncbi:hypothetical protein [Natrinema salifodinae]|uniref:Uncharacterized protein n=1 Tax=Natrinema salifodinae TaxID=1202768 RepID=A0A1I0PLX7_9EURY|nr:hypothetical protein [Natrinema salifodinae]SEW14818.1 hypothetical protein SAMN05216285_2662 [Natrinema salifodinae]
MGLRTALRQNTVILAGLLAAGGWVFVTLLNVSSSMGSVTYGDWIGQSGVAGLVGLVVLLAIGLLVVSVYAELGEMDPLPEEFPPEQ